MDYDFRGFGGVKGRFCLALGTGWVWLGDRFWAYGILIASFIAIFISACYDPDSVGERGVDLAVALGGGGEAGSGCGSG